jgi:hypothetical protein
MEGELIKAASIAILIILPLTVRAKGQEAEKEPKAILEIGGAGEWALNHGTPGYGPNLAVEVTPIKEILEIEAGVTPFFSRSQTEWDTDLFFKNHLPYPKPRSSCAALARNGRIQIKATIIRIP